MFNIIKDPCGLCGHKKVCSMKESYRNFVHELDKKFKMENVPECVSVKITCKYQDVDVRVRDW